MYDNKLSLIMGFHGCDEETCQRLINDPRAFHFNRNSYDWLGNGMYFWENNLERARQWALEKFKQKKIRQPAVLGALIHPGKCCNLLNSKYTAQLAEYYVDLNEKLDIMPRNEDVKSDPYQDKLLRKLDCAVIEHMHKDMILLQEVERQKFGFTLLKSFDTVRSAFLEGAPAFPGSEIRLKNHVQICVRNPNNILAFFRPRLELPFHQAA